MRNRVSGLGLFAALLLVLGLVSGPPASGGPTVIRPPATAADPDIRHVVAVSLDGLSSRAIRVLGRERAPHLHWLMSRGAFTLNARSVYGETRTLPNHATMITGRRVLAEAGGHGVDVNEDPGGTVQDRAGGPVGSVFTRVHRSGRGTALYASKEKFALFQRSWPGGIDRYTFRSWNRRLVDRVVADLRAQPMAFTFVHLSAIDGAGHGSGWMSPRYLDTVAATDRRLGRILSVIRTHARLRNRTMVIVTSDHGGRGTSHSDPTVYANYRIPFLVWGPRVPARADLYALNPGYVNPRMSRPDYTGGQPIRNGAVPNLAASLLGLSQVEGSQINPPPSLTPFD